MTRPITQNQLDKIQILLDTKNVRIKEVDKLIETTNLPEKVDNDFATQILLELYAL